MTFEAPPETFHLVTATNERRLSPMNLQGQALQALL